MASSVARSTLSVLVENLCQDPSASLTRACHFALLGRVSRRMCSLILMVLALSFITQVYDQRHKRKTKLCRQGIILLPNSTSVKIAHNQLANTANQITMFNGAIPLMHTAKLCINCVS
jgi:hypothetical protein